MNAHHWEFGLSRPVGSMAIIKILCATRDIYFVQNVAESWLKISIIIRSWDVNNFKTFSSPFVFCLFSASAWTCRLFFQVVWSDSKDYHLQFWSQQKMTQIDPVYLTGPILEFKGSVRHVQKGHLTYMFKKDILPW